MFNTGNLDSTFQLQATFSEDLWSGIVQDELGNAIPSIFMLKGTSANQFLVSAEENALPGQVNLNIRASRTSGDVVGDTLLTRIIDVPIYRDFELETSYALFSNDDGRLYVEGFANDESKSILMSLIQQW